MVPSKNAPSYFRKDQFKAREKAPYRFVTVNEWRLLSFRQERTIQNKKKKAGKEVKSEKLISSDKVLGHEKYFAIVGISDIICQFRTQGRSPTYKHLKVSDSSHTTIDSA